MTHKTLISLTICCILAVIGGSSVLSFAGNESETNAKAERHLEKANELRKLADHDAAIAEYEKVVSLSPNSDIAQNAQYWIGQSHFKAGQLDASLAAFQTLLDEHPTSKIVASTKRMTQRVQKAKKEKTLVEAVKNGDVEQLKLLISKGADVNATVKAEVAIEGGTDGDGTYVREGWTLLNLAIRHKRADIATLLINQGADVNGRNEHGIRHTNGMPLHYVGHFGNAAVAELLIANGAHVEARTRYGFTPLQCATGYLGPDGSGQLDVIKLLISKGADIEEGDDWDNGPLWWAVRRNHPEVVKVLLDRGADIEARNWRRDTPLHQAVKDERLEIVKLLIKRGAYIDSRNYVDATPLHETISEGNQDMVKLLLANGAIPWRRCAGLGLVGVAMRANQKEMVRFLIDKGIEHSAVHVAAFFGDLDEVKSYLAAGDDINAQDPSRLTLLACAISGGQTAEAEFLISKGADVNRRGSLGYTALHWAVHRNSPKIARMLLDKGADITIRDDCGCTALWWASHHGHKDIVEMLLSRGADVNAKSGVGSVSESAEGWMPLHMACWRGHKDVVEVLIANGADVNAKTKEGETPMSLAKDHGHDQFIELLRKHGAKE
ncbi:MAG: ankyrin repeat domain-containing protein [Planctomycetota bacterium]